MTYSKGDIVVTTTNPFHAFVLTGEKVGQNLLGIKLSGQCSRYKIRPNDIKYTLAQVSEDSLFFVGSDGEGPEQDESSFKEGMAYAKMMAQFDTSWLAASQLEKGDTITVNGQAMKFVEIKPSSPKYPIIVENNAGRRYKVTLRMVPKKETV